MKNVCGNFIPCYGWFCMHTFALIHISLFVCAYILNISIGSTLHRGLVEIIRVQIMLRTDFVRNGQHWNWAVCYGRDKSIRCKNSSRAYTMYMDYGILTLCSFSWFLGILGRIYFASIWWKFISFYFLMYYLVCMKTVTRQPGSQPRAAAPLSLPWRHQAFYWL